MDLARQLRRLAQDRVGSLGFGQRAGKIPGFRVGLCAVNGVGKSLVLDLDGGSRIGRRRSDERAGHGRRSDEQRRGERLY